MRKSPNSQFSGPGARVARPPAADRSVGQTSGMYHHNDDPAGSHRLRRIAYLGRMIVRLTVIRLAIAVALLLPAAPLATEAQPVRKMPTVAVVSPRLDCKPTPGDEALLRGFRELGYVPGSTINIELRCFTTADQLRKILLEVSDRRVDAIAAGGIEAAQAAKLATKTIPIVTVIGDPVALGLAASLARPGGNITGIANLPTRELRAKRVELVKEMIPHASRIAVFFEPSAGRHYREDIEATAQALRVTLHLLELRDEKDLEPAFDSLLRARPDALVVLSYQAVVNRQRRRIIGWANQHRLPTAFISRLPVEEGALMSYGADLSEANWRLAAYVDKILKGAKPGDLPFEQPTKFELVINAKTAKGLGLTIPQSLLLRADQIID